MKAHAAVLAVLFVLAVTVPAPAHHSFTNFWFMDREVEITGVVKEVKLVNPHSELTVEVTGGPQAGTWYITSRATGSGLRRGGWTPETLPVGTVVKVSGNPSRKEGAKALAAGTITLPDGKTLSFGGAEGIPQG
ncbi:MAG: hypothetical protein FJW14_06705 [Acidimicrobiia bacterium]|nr:hypothetical protein [Acidimicrobiia bacterium]